MQGLISSVPKPGQPVPDPDEQETGPIPIPDARPGTQSPPMNPSHPPQR